MAGPARLTPTGLQPGSAETFGTYVSGTPNAKTPLTGTELVPMVQGGAVVHASPKAIGFGPLVRTILTANQNYYVSTSGNDSSDGLSPGSAWATLQHAMNFIAQNIDLAGFLITVNVGTGSFAGVTLEETVGGGSIFWSGNGHANSTITGVGTSLTGGCFTNPGTVAVIESALYCSGFTLDAKTASSCIYLGLTCTFNVGNFATTDVDIIFTNSVNALIVAQAVIVGATVIFFTPSLGTLTVTAPHGISTGLSGFADGQFQDFGTWTITGTPAISGQWLSLTDQAIYTGFASYSGAATGNRVNLLTGASCDTGSGGSATFFPGNSFGNVDNSSSYDGFIGHAEASGLPTTTQFPTPGTAGFYKDTSGGGVYAVYNDAGTIKKVALT